MAEVADPARDAVPAAVDTAGSHTPALQFPDQEPASADGSLIFPSLPRQINQAGLLDFMSMMALMQRCFGGGTTAPETAATPPLDFSTVPAQRRLIVLSPSLCRDNDPTKSPVRSFRTPVRRCRDVDDSPRSTTRSSSPLRT